MILETALGGVVGAITRSVPAVLEFVDKRNERQHEREMFKQQIEADRLRATQEYDQTKLAGDVNFKLADVQALSAALDGQAKMAAAAGGWAATLSAAVRPITTFQLVFLYMMAKLATFVLLCTVAHDATAVLEGIKALYTEADSGLLAGVLAFWYMDRTLAKRA